jgi:hypothetical protein
MMNPTQLMHMLNSEELMSIAREVEEELKRAVDGAL